MLWEDIHQAKILIVDDEPANIALFTGIMQAGGFSNFLTTQDPRGVITQFIEFEPDLIILDLNLPGQSGAVVISLVRNYRRLANTKIIIVSGHPELIESRNYISSRVDFVMRKPFQNDMLLAKINELLALSVS